MKQSQNVNRERLLLAWVRRHPITSVLALWITLLLLAGISTAALVNVNNSQTAKIDNIPSEEPSTAESLTAGTIAVQSPEAERYSRADHQEQGLPWLSFGAIALSCTLGCLIFSQTVRSTGYQPVQRKTARGRNSPPLQSVKTDSPAYAAPEQSPDGSPSAAITSVTVVPKQQNHPLDWEEPSLADSLDMRQRRPLSHWL